MEYEDTNQVDHTPVELVDRAGEADFEVRFNGRAWIKPKGKTTWHLPAYVAVWLLKGDRAGVWTTEQGYVRRFGLGQNDDEVQARLIGLLGKRIEDITPITIDTQAIEGWSLEGAEPRNRAGRDEIRRVHGATLAQRERLGGAARPAFAP
jgi:hypothetical protein